jgi:hypothetical protein
MFHSSRKITTYESESRRMDLFPDPSPPDGAVVRAATDRIPEVASSN